MEKPKFNLNFIILSFLSLLVSALPFYSIYLPTLSFFPFQLENKIMQIDQGRDRRNVRKRLSCSVYESQLLRSISMGLEMLWNSFVAISPGITLMMRIYVYVCQLHMISPTYPSLRYLFLPRCIKCS